MALTNNDIRFLVYLKKQKTDFKNTLMLGRLKFYGNLTFLQQMSEKHLSLKNTPVITDGYSEPVFKFLGADTADSMDISNYENATIIHDLNKPVPSYLLNKFSFIIDSGTLEHVFHFPQAIANCMNMLRTGGVMCGITPVNNLMGHGFYQFSPELLYRIFHKSNGFELKKMLLVATGPSGEFSDWYEVIDPGKAGSRVVLSNSYPTYLMYYAEKTDDVTPFLTIPQQSDYQEIWERTTEKKRGSSWKDIIPARWRDALYAAKNALQTSEYKTKELGALNEKHYKKFNEM